MTPRQAAHRDLSCILAELAGRSRRAQRALLQDHLVRALERAHAAEEERLRFDDASAEQEQRVATAVRELAQIRGECRERMVQIRCQVLSMAEHFHGLESACRAVLPLTTFKLVVDPRSAAARAIPASEEPPTEQ